MSEPSVAITDAASETVEIVAVLSPLVPQVWPQVRPLIERAVEKNSGERIADDVLAALQAAQAQLWMAFRGRELLGVIVTEIAAYPRLKICVLQMIAGHAVDEWAEAALARIEPWAAQLGCRAIEGIGRKGWGPTVKGLGFKQVSTTWRREIAP